MRDLFFLSPLTPSSPRLSSPKFTTILLAFSGGRSAVRGRRIPSFLLLSPIVCVPSVLLSFVSLLSAAGGAPPQLRSRILGFRSEVSGGESRRVRTACVSPMVQSFSFVLGVPVVLVLLGVCSRVSGSACDTGWVFSTAFLSLYGRDWVCGWF